MAPTPPSSGRRLVRRFALLLVVLVVLLVAVVAAAPALVRAGVADGLVAGRLSEAVSGDAGFDRLAVTWAGPQRIEGLRLTDASGDTVIAVDVTARHGLLDLVFGDPAYDVTVTGEIDAAIDETGRISLADLAAPARSGAEARDGSGSPGPTGGDDSETSPLTVPVAFGVDLDQVVLRLDVPEASGGPVVLDGVTGRLAVDASGRASLDLRSAVRRAGREGAFEAVARIDDLHDGRGRVDPLAARVESLLVTANTIPFVSGGRPARVDTARLEASGSPSGVLDARLVVAAVVGAEGADRATGEAASLDVALASRGLFRDGALDLAGAGWSLVIPEARVPAGTVQPFLTAAGVDVARDVGPWVTVTADVSSDPGATSSIRVVGDAAQLELAAVRPGGAGDGLVSGPLEVTRLVAAARLDPALAARVGVGLARPVQVRAEAEPFSVDLAALAEGAFTAPVRIAATLDGGVAGPVAISLDAEDGPTVVTVPAAAITASLDADGRIDVVLRSDRATVVTPAVEGTVALAPLELNASADRADPAGTLVATLTSAPVTVGGAALATVSASVAARPQPAGASGSAAPGAARPADPLDALARFASLDLQLDGLQAGAAERLAGLDTGAIERWVRGDVRLRVRVPAPASAPARLSAAAGDLGRTAWLEAGSRGASGSLALAWDDTTITLASDDLRWRPSNDLLAELMPAPPDGVDGPRPAAVRVRGLGVVRGRVERISAPRSLLAARPAGGGDDAATPSAASTLDLSAIAVALTAEIDSGTIVPASGERAELPPVRLAVDAARLDEPRLRLVTIDAPPPAEGAAAQASRAPAIDIDLAVRGGGLDGTATVRNVDVALVEAAAGTGDLLSMLVGPRLAATAAFTGFSSDTGSVDFETSGTYGRAGGRVRGELGALVVDAAQPLVVSVAVHEELRDRLLAPIQPIFAGVSRSDGPVTLTVGPALVPLSDGIEAAVAEFRVESGRLELESGFDLLSVVALFDGSGGGPGGGGETVEAQLTPISGTLQAGAVVTGPARLVLTKGASIDIASGGRVDLVNQTLDYRASMPLKWLGSVFREARGVADSVTVPLIARGPLASASFQVDPSFDLGRLLVEAGLGGLLERELGPEGAAAGRLLGEILKGLGGGGGG